MKNHEGYPDPTANEAINGVRKEEKQRLLEKKHGQCPQMGARPGISVHW